MILVGATGNILVIMVRPHNSTQHRAIYIQGKGMVPHVQLSTNSGLGCLQMANKIFSITPTANPTVGFATVQAV